MENICRKFEGSDIYSLINLMNQLGYEHTENSLAKNIFSVRAAGGEVFVAEVEGSICGCISAILDARLAEGVNGEIVSLVVCENMRGTGIGKSLVSVAENWLKSRTSSISIRANSIRKEAHLFYEKLGYTPVKTQTVFKKFI